MNTKHRPTTYIVLSVNTWADETLRFLQPESAALRYFYLTAWSKTFNLDGRFTKLALSQCGGNDAELEALVKAGLVAGADDGSGYLIVDYGVWQTTSDEIDSAALRISAKRAESGRRGGLKSGESRRKDMEQDAPAAADGGDWHGRVYASLKSKPDSYGWAHRELDQVPAEHRDAVERYLRGRDGKLQSLLKAVNYGRSIPAPPVEPEVPTRRCDILDIDDRKVA